MKVIFFAPYAALWPHAFPEALVANELKRDGAEIIYIGCDGTFKQNCLTYSAMGLSIHSSDQQKANVCAKCGDIRRLLANGLNVTPDAIENYLETTDRNEIEAILKTITRENFASLSIQGLPLGRFALYEIILHHKLTDLAEMNEQAHAEFRATLRNVLTTFFSARRFLVAHKPDRIVLYNTLYSTNYTLAQMAAQLNIPVYSLHAGGNMADRFSTLMVMPGGTFPFYRQMVQRFESSYHQEPADRAGLQTAFDHFRALTLAKSVFVYSAPKSQSFFDIYGFFGIKKNQKILLATLSSYDEMFASLTNGSRESISMVFPTQIEWMRALVAHLRTRPDLFLIIRVHPREFPNRREGVHSTHAKRLAEEFKDLPENVRINWPTDEVSLYDLVTNVDAVLNGWSSAGKEMSMLGLPVVIFTKDALLYPPMLNFLATSVDDYFQKIDEALQSGWSLERVILAYRWLALEYSTGTIAINDRFRFSEGRKPLITRAFNKFRRTLLPYYEQRKAISNLRKPLRNGRQFVRAIIDQDLVPGFKHDERKALDKNEEKDLIIQFLERIIADIYSGPEYQQTKLIKNMKRTIDDRSAECNGVTV